MLRLASIDAGFRLQTSGPFQTKMDGEDAGRHSISMRALIRSELSECKDSRETD